MEIISYTIFLLTLCTTSLNSSTTSFTLLINEEGWVSVLEYIRSSRIQTTVENYHLVVVEDYDLVIVEVYHVVTVEKY
jgi:hypothetical protein